MKLEFPLTTALDLEQIGQHIEGLAFVVENLLFRDKLSARDWGIEDTTDYIVSVSVKKKPRAKRKQSATFTTSGIPYPKNQCDGCAQGLPVVDGLHRTVNDKPFMACEKSLYRPACEMK